MTTSGSNKQGVQALNKKLVKKVKGQWQCEFRPTPSTYEGFIYIVINKTNKEYYIGKRGYKTKSRKPSEHWKTYRSSSKTLKKLISENYTDYEFYIIEQYKTKSGLNYAEIWSQMIFETPSDSSSLNYKIQSMSYKSKEKITERHKKKMQELKVRLDSK